MQGWSFIINIGDTYLNVSTMMTKQARYKAFIEYFSNTMPTATTELVYRTPFELLVAVILSAQCTDKRVNQVTTRLFLAFPTPAKLAGATVAEVLSYIQGISYPNSKATYLVGTANRLVTQHQGEIPDTLGKLVALPGVGRKTANVILSVVYQQPMMAVDTHVMRVSKRLGLVEEHLSTPLAIEQELVSFLPKKYIMRAHHWLILHGRYVCTARKPKCSECPITNFCAFFTTQR